MRIKYKQRYGITLVSLFDHTLLGLTSIRSGDKYDRNLGLAIALVKAHTKLNKREQKLAHGLFDIPWKSFQVPEESVGKVMIVALQYRQAIGHTVVKYGYDGWGDEVRYYAEEDWDEGEKKGHPVLFSQNDKPVCEVAEAFGKRLIKMSAL